jgi:acetoacetyl-CoA reductase/3-oxoacyl-[acyl-carrier protein] reductase
LWGLTKSIAVENANRGITINNLNLGYFNIGMITEVPKDFQEITKQKIPTKEFGNPKNIFESIKFIIENDYLNGASIDVNGAII